MKDDSVTGGIPQDDGEDVELTGLIDDELIAKLDSLKRGGNIYKKYSEIYRGGIYALRARSRADNPDWMSQSANSFREILYVLKQKEAKDLKEILQDYLGKSLTKKEVERYKEYLNNLYALFSDLTHHFSTVPDLSLKTYQINKNLEIKADAISKDDYFNAIKLYKEFLKLLVTTALDIHKKIDDCIKNNRRKKDLVKVFFNNSADSKSYFLSQVDDSWLEWLWTNGFFVQLKKPAEDVTKYSYRLPELQYIVRMAEKKSAVVAKIIASVPISKATLNPEVVDRFLWILSLLPVEQIKDLLPKILSENWVALMSPYHRSGYEHIKIMEKIKESGDNEALLGLAKIILTPRTKEELHAIEGFISSDKLFYLSDITETGLFDQLLDPANIEREKTLALMFEVLSKVVTYGKDREGDSFGESEPFYLLYSDVFTIEINNTRKSYTRDDIENVIAVTRLLIEELFTVACGNAGEVRRLYDTYISQLPDSRTLYRLRLYAVTRCPTIFQKELKELFFRLFEVGERYTDIEGGAEYHSALIAGFGALDATTQREYLAKAFEYFGAELEEKEMQKYRKNAGLEITTYVKDSLTKEEIEQSEKLFGKLPEGQKLEPHPGATMGEAGFVAHRSPVNVADFSIDQIIEHLKTEWSPAVLKEQYGGDDFLSPRGTEGLGDALKEDIKKRLDAYLAKLGGFFDRERIAPQYVYSMVRGIEEMLRNKETFTLEQAGKIIEFFEVIKTEGLKAPFQRGEEKNWLADWIEVHKVVVDALLFLTENKALRESLHAAYRDKIRDIISYLLTIQGSPSKEHEKPEYGEPYHVAINSVRGRAYEALVVFAENDGKALSDDVKEIYQRTLRDESIAVHFVIGRYLGVFYFRDKDFVKEMLPDIFPKDDPARKDMYLASWEGYLSNTLYDQLFTEFKEYYEHAIGLDPATYTDRKYTKSLDELLAVHLSLAYIHLGFKIGDPLFDLFWKTPNATRHYEFASFIGRSCLTRDQAGDEWLKEHNVSKERLIEFWNWMLTTELPIEPKAFAGFGFWVNPNKEVIDEKIIIKNLAATLKKSDGEIDWDYGLTQRLKVLAEVDPANTLEIIRNYLLKDGELNPHRRSPLFSLEHEIKEALSVIYKVPTLKNAVKELIDTLIEKGSSSFWGLKDVLE